MAYTPFKMKGPSLYKNSPAKEHKEGHKEEEEKVVHAENKELANYLQSDGKKTIRGGIAAAKAGYANQSGPKIDIEGGAGGFLSGILGGK